MGAKTWFVAWMDPGVNVRKVLQGKPSSDAARAASLASSLFPGAKVRKIGDGTLGESLNPPDGEAYIGCYPGLTVIAAPELGADDPTATPSRFLRPGPGRVVVHAMHSVVDWFAFAVWEDGKLRRALSLSPDSGVIKDLGRHYPFEEPYWAGERPVDDEYPLPFHPLELAEDVLRSFFGFVMEGEMEDDDPEVFEIPMTGFGTA